MNRRLISRIIKDIINLDMVKIHDQIVGQHGLSDAKSNNSYFVIYSYEMNEDSVKEALVDIVHELIKNSANQIKTTSGCKDIDKICDFIDDSTIDIFFDISSEEDEQIIICKA